jgi:hypothetical protein
MRARRETRHETGSGKLFFNESREEKEENVSFFKN